MGMIETQVWNAWLTRYSHLYLRVSNNVPLWWQIPPEQTRPGEKQFANLNPPDYRIDAVAWNGQVCDIIEVKDTANLTAIGQLLAYRILFERTYFGYSKLCLLLVCKRIRPSLLSVCRMLEIWVDIYPFTSTQSSSNVESDQHLTH